MAEVTITDTVVTIPTYGTGEPDKNPQFIENRVYQGSSGKVYPYPVIESIADDKEDRKYRAVVIENDYLEVTVLPELGGRIQYARDKTNGYDFVYRNEVIKPALVGLLGPWISGGIEFNWPQHHRPTTYLPVDHRVVELADGGRGVQCHDVDQIHGTEVVTTVALYPGKAYIAITGDLYNGTSFPQSFLWWANPAVPVNEHTKTVMPPDVSAVMDHGKRDVSRYPIATGVYYKHDYSEGVDIGRYKNVPVPTSYMAARSSYDFVGGYDFERKAGILHYADHHVSPGKKQWTWGNGDFGRAWDRNLTDENGPYVELMTGVYTDNQPDFAWLKPFESKTFTQYFMPYKRAGLVKNATLDAAVNLEFGPVDPALAAGEHEGVEGEGLSEGQGRVIVYSTQVFERAKVEITATDGTVLFSDTRRLSPTDVLLAVFPTQGVAPENITVSVVSGNRVLVDYTPREATVERLPDPAHALPDPPAVPTNEELLLAGLHLEQYRHATYRPDSYYLEGLKRDPRDSRINNAYGLLLLRRGAFREAKTYFEAAIARLTQHNPNPYDCEAYFNLGLAQRFLGEDADAFDAFYKAIWDSGQQEMGYYHLSALLAKRGDFSRALDFVDRALSRNTGNMRARGLRAYLLRRLGRHEQAVEAVERNLKADAFDFVSGFERWFVSAGDRPLSLMRGFVQNYLKTAREYAAFGAYEEALDVLDQVGGDDPMVSYHKAYYLDRLGRCDEAVAAVGAGERASSYCCFPNKLDDIAVLENAIALGGAVKAPYYLGCLYYDRLQSEHAIALWESSRDADPDFPTVHRNLALAYFNKRGDHEAASIEMEQAYALDPSDPRVFLELDQLHRSLGWSYERRLEEFERHPDVVGARDDLYVEYLTVLNMTGHYRRALTLMRGRHFHPWEGGEGKITTQYRISLMLLAHDAMAEEEWSRARDLLMSAQTYPHNLGEGKLEGQKDNDLHYYLGVVQRQLGDERAAREEFRLASVGPDEVKGAMYYNDQPAEMILFQGLAHQALGERGAANARFYRLLDYGEQHMDDDVSIDYFAVSLPDFLIFDRDLTSMNHVHCQYLMALANIGLGHEDAAQGFLERVLAEDPSHIQANLFMIMRP